MPPVLRFGKYVIDGLLGPGGVTETYLAHVEHERERPKGAPRGQTIFVLKLLRRDRVEPSAWAHVAQRFVAAGRQLRDFRRPGFGKVFEVSDDASATFIVSEHLAGSDLGRLVELCRCEGAADNRMNARLTGLIGAEIARLLHVGHSAKPILCHHGLSPSNVIVLPSGDVTLLDAGIAAGLRGITEQPPERWGYVAPEVHGLDLGVARLSEREAVAADLYALGALLHTMLHGRAPARGSSGRAVAGTAFASELDGKLGAAMRTLLATEPDDRPESASVLVEWLSDGVSSARERRNAIAEAVSTLESVARAPSQSDLPSAGEAATGLAIPQPGVQTFVRAGVALSAGDRARRLGLVLTLLAAICVLVLTRVASCTDGSTIPELAPEASATGRASAMEATATRPATGTLANEGLGSGPVVQGIAGHLIVETIPPGASVWVDGMLRGTSFTKVFVGTGRHDVALVMPGHRMYRSTLATDAGVIIRRTLEAIAPTTGPASIRVTCATQGQYPILIDDREVGHMCGATVPVAAGRHQVGIYVPPQRRVYSVEAHAQSGATPAWVTFVQ